MTVHKHLKQLVRARMEKTGEAYATARRQVIGKVEIPALDPALRAHFPGNVPAATALRVLLTHAGVTQPDTGQPFSEAMLFGIAGGIGMGVFSFRYEKEDFSSFFVAGRHKWADDLDYLRSALGLFDVEPVVRESTSPAKAMRDLGEALARTGPCIAWVDRALLPHRAFPGEWSGAYHVVTVYRMGPHPDSALIGDLTDDPISISLKQLAETRGRIKKQRNRLLSVASPAGPPDLSRLIRAGLKNCVRELLEPSMKSARRNFQLAAIRTWADRMEGSTSPESWERTFRRGRHLWRGLTSIYDYSEHYGTGGGLCRPLFADFLAEAAQWVPETRPLAEQYAGLGRMWSDLAAAALPEDVPLLREARQVLAQKAELLTEGGEPSAVARLWERFSDMQADADADFPLSEDECRSLRASLKQRLLEIADAEDAAFAELRKVAGV